MKQPVAFNKWLTYSESFDFEHHARTDTKHKAAASKGMAYKAAAVPFVAVCSRGHQRRHIRVRKNQN